LVRPQGRFFCPNQKGMHMPALNINDLNNGKKDLDHIAEVATSIQPTATDRLGNQKLTVRGAVDSIKLANPRGAWAAGTQYESKDVVSFAGTWYFCVVPHLSSLVFADDAANWRVYQGITWNDLAAATASSGVGYVHAEGGVNGTTLQTALRAELHNVNLYFIAGEADAKPMFVRALAAQKRVWVPPGNYNFNSSLPIPNNRILDGDGPDTILSFNVAGDGITSTCAINASTSANVTISNLTVKCTNGANTGAGFAQIGGSYVDVYKVIFNGWKYSIIFDQTEISTIRHCQLVGPSTGGIWLTNGQDHTPGAAVQYTNRITIEKNQINLCPIGIIDDGGYVHTIRDNNFNGGNTQIRAAGIANLTIGQNEFEAAAIGPIDIQTTTYKTGTGVGGSLVSIEDNTINPGANFAVNIAAGGGSRLISRSNLYAGSGTAKIVGLRNCTTIVLQNDGVAAGPYTDSGDINPNIVAQLVYGGALFYQNGSVAPLFSYKADFTGGGAEGSKFDLQANNNGGGRVTYSGISMGIYGNGAGAESGILYLKTANSGAYAARWALVGAGQLYPMTDNSVALGGASNRISVVFAGSATINTSDEREKQQVQAIDAAALRAWAKVEYLQFKFNDAVEHKGDGARWHFGVMAQHVKAAFESEGLDAFAYGLLCYDQWPEQPEVRDDDGVVVVPYRAAGNRYGIRYEEALALECAYLRSQISKGAP
jgi:hypothetical protein